MDKYLSIITNFGCHYSCPYCIVKNNYIDVPETTVGGLDKLVENIRKYKCNWVSISGGGDPLYEFDKNAYWYYRLFHVVPDGVKFELMCVGQGYGKYAKYYKGHPQIHIIGERSNIGDYMNLADYFVLSSDFEGLPLTLLEAMSMGVTPISTPAGGVADVIKDGANGYITKGFDDEEFYQKIKMIIKTKGKLPPDVICRDYAENYSMQACVKKYCAVYIRVCGLK